MHVLQRLPCDNIDMGQNEFGELASAWESIATIIALIAAAGWAILHFTQRREGHPYVEFTAEIRFVRKHDQWWIVELIAWVENKGKVQHLIDNFAFDLHALFVDDEVEQSAELNGQVYFPHQIAGSPFMPTGFGQTFVDPGVKAHYSHVTCVPESATTLIMHAWFDYGRRWYQSKKRRTFHAAEATVRVPANEAEFLKLHV